MEGGEQYASKLVNYADVAFVSKVHALYKAVDAVQIHAGTGYSHQLPVAVHRNSAHYSQTRSVGVLGHGCHESLACGGSALIPRTGLGVQRHQHAVFVVFLCGYVVGLYHYPLIGSKVDRRQVLGIVVYGVQRFLQVAYQSCLADDLRGVGIYTRSVEDLYGKLAVLCGVRERRGSARVGIAFGIQLFGGGGYRAYSLTEFVERPVRKCGLVVRKLLKAFACKSVHVFGRHVPGRSGHLPVGVHQSLGQSSGVYQEDGSYAKQRSGHYDYYGLRYLGAQRPYLFGLHVRSLVKDMVSASARKLRGRVEKGSSITIILYFTTIIINVRDIWIKLNNVASALPDRSGLVRQDPDFCRRSAAGQQDRV